MEHNSDQEIIGRILNGNTTAFKYLVDKYKDRSLALILKVTNDRALAEDALQEAFISAFRNLNSYRSDAEFSTWFYRIAYNSALATLRKEKKHPKNYSTSDDTPLANEIRMESNFLELRDKRVILNEILSRLKDEDRTILTLFYYNDQKVSEISSIMGLKESNVKVRLFRARNTLEIALKEYLGKEITSIL